MAQKVIVQLTDDIDGTEAKHTVRFAYEAKSYVIDLNDKNKAAFEAALKKWVDAARPDTGKGSTSKRTRTAASKPNESAAIREWAAANGIQVKDKGAVSRDVRAQWEAAGSPGLPA